MDIDEIMQYDEENAVKFIQNFLPEELKDKYSDDEILYIIDITYDYYEDKGLLSLDDDSLEVKLDIDNMVEYVKKAIKKDKGAKYDLDDISFIIQGSLAYEETLDI